MRNENRLLEEAYEKILKEGIWDKFKARTASATTSVGSSVGGYFKGLGNAITGNLEKQQAAMAQRQNAQQAAKDAKIDSFLKSKASKIEKLASDIESDLNALQINNKEKPITKDTLFNSIYNNVLANIKNTTPTAEPEKKEPTLKPEPTPLPEFKPTDISAASATPAATETPAETPAETDAAANATPLPSETKEEKARRMGMDPDDPRLEEAFLLKKRVL